MHGTWFLEVAQHQLVSDTIVQVAINAVLVM